MKKRILSFLMALLMVVSIIPFNIFAEGEPEPTPPEVEGTSEPTTEPVTDPPCDTCGAYDCESEHLTWCADCRMDDCGKTHVFCEICQKNDCGQNHCPTCGTIDCTADHGAPAAETPEEPDVHPMVGKVVKLKSDLTSYSGYYGENLSMTLIGKGGYPSVMKVTAVLEKNDVVYCRLAAVEGSWSFPEYDDNFYLESTKLEAAVWCTECEKYDCGVDHTQPTDPTEPPTEPEVPELDDGKSGIVLKGTFPTDVSLSVKPADVSSQLSQFGVSGEKLVFGLDISLMRSGVDYQPGTAVRVKVPVSADVGTKIGILHTHGGNTTYMGLTEVQSDGTVEFTTDRFSTFAGFTVDFHYNEIEYSIAGLTSIKLSELFTILEIDRQASNAASVVFSDTSLIKVTKTDGDWLLESLKAFDTEETLEITFYDGEIITIDVTDASAGVQTTDDQVLLSTSGLMKTYQFFGTLYPSVYGHYSSYSGSTLGHDAYFYLYEGNAYPGTGNGSQIAKAKITDAYDGVQFNVRGNYWFEVYDTNHCTVSECGTTNFEFDTNNVFYTDDSVYIRRYPLTTYHNQSYCTVNQTSVMSDSKTTRTVYIYANGTQVGNWTGYFPDRTSAAASDLTVTPYGNWKGRGDVSSNATVVVSNGNYYVYLVSTHTVTWKNWDGSTLETDTDVVYGTTPAYNSATPTRATAEGYSYSFSGWSPTVATVTANVTYTAQFNPSPISYSVSFNGNGATGGSMSDQSFKFGTAQNLTANAYKREYTVTYNTNGGNAIAAATAKATFNGWEDRGSIVYKGTTYSYTTFDAPFYANKYGDLMNAFGYNKYNLLNHWVTYTVNGSETRIARGDAPGLYPNGASVSNLATTNGYTVPLYADWILGSVTLPTPTKAGYTFTGWSDGSNTYASGATYTPTANVTLTALWEKSGYTVTWKNWDGEVLETDENVAAGTTPEYNGQTPVREGNAQYSYTFDKWSPAIAAVTGDATYTATYTATPVPYTVTWVYGNGTENKVETVAYGAAITKPTDPTRTGYNFTGWSPEVPATMPAEDQTFTAQWEGKKYTLTVYATYGQPNTHSEYEVQYGTDLNNNLRSVITTPAGFGLKGLYTQTNSGGTRVYDANAKWLTGTDYWDDAGHWKYDGNLTVYADWESIEYTITYVDTLDNTTTTAKYTTYLPAYYLEGRSREGYNFDGWKVKETAGHWTAGSIHLAGASCVGLYGDVTLETVWTPIEYTITYELNGGTLAEGVSNPEKYTIETQTFTLYNPIKPGYKFKGWATSADATTGTETVTIEEGTIGEKAFYALWERSLVDLTITATTSDRDQNFIFTVSGTRSDGVAFESIDVVLCNENGFQVTIKDMPVGQYTVAEKNNWSWRESDVGSQNADLRTEGKTVSFGFGSVDDLHWLSDYSYRKKGGS